MTVRRLIFALLLAASAHAQIAQSPDVPSLLAEVPSVPGLGSHLRGVNVGVTLTGVHDSSSGWYTLATPAFVYTFTPHYSLDLSIPIYLDRLVEVTTTTQTAPGPGQPPPPPVTTSSLQPRHMEPGDLVIAAHALFARNALVNTFTPSLTLPSGNVDDGLSTGRVTFDFDDRLQFDSRTISPLVDIGIGDSSNLVNRLVTRDYTSLGPLAHFQVGLSTAAPLGFLGERAARSTFQAVAYEQLPIGDNKLYTTVTRPGFPPRTVVSGHSVSEDNGFTNSLAIPLNPHLTLQGYYNRSLRLRIDTAAVGITWVLRPQPKPKKRQSSLLDGLITP